MRRAIGIRAEKINRFDRDSFRDFVKFILKYVFFAFILYSSKLKPPILENCTVCEDLFLQTFHISLNLPERIQAICL